MTAHKDWKKQRRFRQALAKLLQHLFRRRLCRPPYRGPIGSIAILAQEKYGDAILLTPLLKNLKTAFPHTEIHLITFSKAVTGFFSTDPNVTEVHYAKGITGRHIKLLFGIKFDLLFNTKDHPSTTFLIHSILVRTRVKAGIDNEFHRGLYDYLVTIDFHSPIALKNCGLMTILGRPVPERACRPYLPPRPVSAETSEFLETSDLSQAFGINISAGWPTRYWTTKNWKELIGAFPARQFVILSAPEDTETKKTLEASCPTVIASPPTASLYEAGLIVEQLRLLITPDTSMVHIASCFDTPVVGLYGAAQQDQSRFRPFLVDYRMVSSPTPVVRDIDPKQVIEAARQMVSA